MTWTKETPISDTHKHEHVSGCMNCPPKPITADMRQLVAVGFGAAHATKNGKYVEGTDECARERRGLDPVTFADVEKLAAEDPDHDWRIILNAPLGGCTYQRHDVATWVMIEKNNGFA